MFRICTSPTVSRRRSSAGYTKRYQASFQRAYRQLPHGLDQGDSRVPCDPTDLDVRPWRHTSSWHRRGSLPRSAATLLLTRRCCTYSHESASPLIFANHLPIAATSLWSGSLWTDGALDLWQLINSCAACVCRIYFTRSNISGRTAIAADSRPGSALRGSRSFQPLDRPAGASTSTGYYSAAFSSWFHQASASGQSVPLFPWEDTTEFLPKEEPSAGDFSIQDLSTHYPPLLVDFLHIFSTTQFKNPPLLHTRALLAAI